MINNLENELIIYKTDDGQIKIEVRLEDENLWLTQQMMADLFQTTKQNVSLHIQNIYEEGELTSEATVKKYLTVRTEGTRNVKRLMDFYNLDMIISVGYRVKSIQDEINLLKKLSEQYKTQKKGLMQKLLTGEWRVKFGD